MSVTVKFVGSLRNLTGRGRITLKVDGEKALKEIIDMIIKDFPKTNVLLDPELKNPKPNTLIIVNEKEISVLNGLETIIKDGDEIVFVPVSHGG
ncbi:MAG: MoaD/ThiS family protein [Candidatus Bathyarchaeia archaeon]|nr:MoaD/ThiS family protein [Candidatus Bathyarchaeota archaeon]